MTVYYPDCSSKLDNNVIPDPRRLKQKKVIRFRRTGSWTVEGYIINRVSDDNLDDEGLSWVCMVDPTRVLVISRGPSSLPECLSLSVRRWPDVGATNEIKTLALFSKFT